MNRDNIKNALLSELGNGRNDFNRIKDECLCLSSIAAIEVPLKMWDNFIEMMTTQSNQDEDEYNKMAAMHLIGLFIEAISSITLVGESVNMIWESLIKNIESPNRDVTLIVAKALVRLAPVTKVYFQYD